MINNFKQVDLTKRTQLTPSQLEKVKGGSGKGQSTKYDSNGKQNLELTRRLAKAKRKAKRFILFSDQLGRRIYVADPTTTNLNKGEAPLTFNRKEALEFYEGFDDPERKKKYFNGAFDWQTS